MKQKIINFILENLDDGYGGVPPAEEWAEEVLNSNKKMYTFRSKYVKKGKNRNLFLDNKVEVFRVEAGWPHGFIAERFEPNHIPKNYYKTKEEATAAYEGGREVIANSRTLVKQRADEIFKDIEKDYSDFLLSLQYKYGAEVYPNGTGLETYTAVDFTIKGEDGISHEFNYLIH